MLPAAKKAGPHHARNKIKDVVAELDRMVPLTLSTRRQRSVLESGRTVQQLVEDLLVHVRAVVERDAIDGDHGGRRAETEEEGVCASLIKEGMLGSATLMMMVLDASNLTITSMSQGLLSHFKGLPFVGPVGQSAEHFVAHEDKKKFAEFVAGMVRAPGEKFESEFRMITCKGNFAARRFGVDQGCCENGNCILLLSTRDEPIQQSESLEELSNGVYELDEILSSDSFFAVQRSFKSAGMSGHGMLENGFSSAVENASADESVRAAISQYKLGKERLIAMSLQVNRVYLPTPEMVVMLAAGAHGLFEDRTDLFEPSLSLPPPR
eukprot:767743-Hanusia_phi.AAC.8